MKKFYLLVILFLPFFLIGQTVKLPDVIKPSPQAGEMTKYIDYPMDLSSGLPSINIPLYTISTLNFNIPISISYHASGLKPNEEETGVIGLGWNLNAFGMISRSINKDADEKSYNVKIKLVSDIHGTNTDVLSEDPDVAVLDAVAKRNFDMSPDIFSYSTPNGIVGKFVFRRSDTISEFLQPILLPYKSVKITPTYNQNQFEYFDITDEKGNTYRFGKSITSGQTVYEDFKSISGFTISDGHTSWLLTEIISANKMDTIYFEYDDVLNSLAPPNIRTTLEKINIEFSQAMSNSTGPDATPATVSTNYVVNSYTQKKITKITFKGGYVKFTYKSNVYPEHLLEKIEVFKNEVITPFKTIKLNQTKYHNDSSKLNWYKLDEIGFYDSNNIKINKYGFEYKIGGSYGFPFPDRYIQLGDSGINTLAIDFWGYYNGANGNQNLLASEFTWNILKQNTLFNLFGSANRTPNYDAAQTGILKKIIFPTGGERIFEYEGNVGASGDLSGGVRVKSIINKTNGEETKRTFTYFGYSKKIQPEYFKNFTMSINTPDNQASSLDDFANNYSVSSSPNVDININGRPIVYWKVNEFDGDVSTNNGWIEHLFDTSILERYPILKLRTIQPPFFPWWSSEIPTPLPVFSNNVIFGDINENVTNTYNKQEGLIKTVKNNYSHTIKQRTKGFSASALIKYSPNNEFRKSGAYNFYNYDIQQLSQKLDSTETIEYLGGTPLIYKEEYKYNDNLFVTEQKSQKSNGRTIISKTVYPDEVTAITSLGNDSLTPDEFNAVKRLKSSSNDPNGLNKIGEIIQTSVYEDINSDGQVLTNELLNVQRTNYKDWGNNNVLPKETQSLKGVYNSSTNNLQDEIIFNDYYTNGNIKEVSKANGIHIIYIWGYNQQYPIAKIENATFAGLSSGIQTIINTAVAASDNDVDETTENSLRTTLNNIRNQFPNAIVTTYTYNPLIGITSVTDPKGYTTYYTYDSFNRLQKTKDHSSNILNEYSYNYASSPLVPTGLTFSGSTATTLSFAWTAVAGATGYKIYKDGVYVSSTTSTLGTLSGLLSLTSYNVQVLAYNFIGDGTLCPAVAMSTAIPIPLPVQPTGLVLTSASSTSINFSWNTVSSADGYKIYLNGGYLKSTASISGSISGLISSTSYNIQILAYNSSGDGALCSTVAMSTLTGPPATAPTGLIFKSASTSAINFSWDTVAGATGYKLYVNGVYISSTTSISGSVSGLTPSTSYNVQVLAYNISGDGTLSSSVSMFTTGVPVFGFKKKSGVYPTISPSLVEGTIFNGSGSTIYIYLVAQSGTATSGSGTAIANIHGTSINKSATFTQSGQSIASTSYVALPSNSTTSYYVKGNYFGTTQGSQMILAYSLSPGGSLIYWSTSN